MRVSFVTLNPSAYNKIFSGTAKTPFFNGSQSSANTDEMTNRELLELKKQFLNLISKSNISGDVKTYLINKLDNKDNYPVLEQLLKLEINETDSISIIKELNNNSRNIAQIMLEDVNFPNAYIPEIMENTTAQVRPFNEMIIRDKNLNSKQKSDIISLTGGFNVNLALMAYYDKDFDNQNLSDLLRTSNVRTVPYLIKIFPTYPKSQFNDFAKRLCIMESSPINWQDNNSQRVENKHVHAVMDKILSNEKIPNMLIHSAISNVGLFFELYNQDNFLEHVNQIDKLYNTMRKNSQKYINGDLPPEQSINLIDEFFCRNYIQLINLSNYLDKDAMDNLMRKRLNNVSVYENIIEHFSEGELFLLKRLNSSKNIEGKDFLPKQKVEFIDLIQGYRNNYMDMDLICDMAEKGVVDLKKLHEDLFAGILSNLGMTENEPLPYEKLILWNTDYIPLLACEINKGEKSANAIRDFFEASIFNDFDSYIHDKNNLFGKANLKTQKIFKLNNFDYEKWLHVDKEKRFVLYDESSKEFEKLVSQITNEINILRETAGMRKFIDDKKFSYCIKNGNFVIPDKYLKSRQSLYDFVTKFLNETKEISDRAFNNSGSYDYETAIKGIETFTVYKTIERYRNNILNQEDKKPQKTIDYTIRMWKRNPYTDLFEGNYSNCCVGMGKTFGYIMPQYLMNTMFNMIEIYDNDTKKIIGNALCYFVKDEEDRIYLAIDNIEIIGDGNNLQNETAIKLRNAIFDYSKEVTKEVTGRSDIGICMGYRYNDLPTVDLEESYGFFNILGAINHSINPKINKSNNIYLDLFKGMSTDSELKNRFCKILCMPR